MRLVVRHAHLSPSAPGGRGGGPPPPATVDVVVEHQSIVAVGPGAGRRGGDEVVDAGGGWLLPGLWDHHVHLRAAAAAGRSVAVGPPEVAGPDDLALRLRQAAHLVPPGRWVRAVGYHESVAGGLDRRALDALVPDRPVRVQHASGAMWVLNSAGLSALGPEASLPAGAERDGAGSPTGRLFREDRWLAGRVDPVPSDLASLSAAAAGLGVIGFTDATAGRDVADAEALAAASAAGEVVQRLHLMVPAGVEVPVTPRVTAGPEKILLDDTRLPAVEDLAARLRRAHGAGRPVSLHCVTRVQAVVSLAALEASGAVDGDRIEHGAVLPPELVSHIGALGVLVVTQPAMAARRGDRYLASVDPRDRPDLWRAGSLLAAGVRLAAGSDAPFGPLDPWDALEAATERRTPSGAVLGPAERLDGPAALALLTGRPDAPWVPRRVEPGQPADLCLVDRPPAPPWEAGRPEVLATVVAGALAYRRG